jgi:hypothetical protein
MEEHNNKITSIPFFSILFFHFDDDDDDVKDGCYSGE